MVISFCEVVYVSFLRHMQVNEDRFDVKVGETPDSCLDARITL